MKKLTMEMQRVLAEVKQDWGRLPLGTGCTNATLKALETRGLIELRLKPGQKFTLFGYMEWEARRTPSA